jgi:hypothetical protein
MRSTAVSVVTFGLCLISLASRPPKSELLVLPSGTPLRVQLETKLSSEDNKLGDAFAARVIEPVYVEGKLAIPADAIIEGHVTHVRDSRPITGSSELLLRPDLLSLPGGQQYTISADVTQTDALTQTKTNAEGVIRTARVPDRGYVRRSGVTTAMSAITGAAVAGGRGALWGGAFGAAAAGGWWFLRHRHVELNAGSELVVRIDRDVTLVANDKAGVSGADAPAPATSAPSKPNTSTESSAAQSNAVH